MNQKSIQEAAKRLKKLKHPEKFGELGICLCVLVFFWSSPPCLQEGINEKLLEWLWAGEV